MRTLLSLGLITSMMLLSASDSRGQEEVGVDLSAGKHLGLDLLGVDDELDLLGVGTELRVIRIAGANGTGEYWGHWSPFRLSLRL